MSVSRKLGVSVLGLAAIMVMTGCGGSGKPNPAGAPGGGGADASTIVVGSWGGDYQAFLKEFVGPALQKEENAPEVVFATADNDARLAKLRAEQNGDKGTMDVVALGDIQMAQAVQGGLLEKLDESKIPNLKYLKEGMRNPYWVSQIYSPSIIIYNKDKVSPAPTSYNDLWDEKYAGKIGIQVPQPEDYFHAAATLALGQNATTDLMAGLPLLEKLAPATKVFSSQEQLGEALMSGQVWMALDWKARAYQWIETSETPLAAAVPKEGTFSTAFVMGIPKNAPHKDAAYKYLNAILAPNAQLQFGKNMGYLPTVTNSGIPRELADRLGVAKSDEHLVEQLDVVDIAKNYNEEVTAWQQKIINR